jgi:hypothetical protein
MLGRRPDSLGEIGCRWALLLTGWACVCVSLRLPGFYYPGDAWFPPGDMVTFWTVLGFCLGVLSPEPPVFVASWVFLLGTLLFFLSPLALVHREWRVVATVAAWWSPAMLSVWAYDLIAPPGAHNVTRYGYYIFAAGYTLVFLALAPRLRPVERWRRRRGLCALCGYDLRGRPNAPACPECGAAASRATA